MMGQREIVAHFAKHVPAARRARFLMLVSKALKDCREGNLGMQTTAICLDVMKYLSRRVEER
jgi:hypothetical protein